MSKFQEVFNNAVSNISYKLEKNSPEILVVTGVIGLVTAGVLACRATIKAKEVTDQAKKDLEMIHDCEANETLKESGEYTDEDAKKDKTIVTVRTIVHVGKHYILPAAVAGLSIYAIFKSHNIMVERNVSLSAAYTGLATAFTNYRKKVVEKFGEDADKEMRYGLKAVKVEEEQVDENGKKKVKKVTKTAIEGIDCSDYARFFDASSRCWVDDAEYNLVFLKQQQAWLNKELRSRNGRPLYLNEVYDALDMERSDAGQRVGWKYLPNDPTHHGDNFIDFGIYDTNRAKNRDFVNGIEPVILLDFNVDGEVFETSAPRKSPRVYGH